MTAERGIDSVAPTALYWPTCSQRWYASTNVEEIKTRRWRRRGRRPKQAERRALSDERRAFRPRQYMRRRKRINYGAVARSWARGRNGDNGTPGGSASRRWLHLPDGMRSILR